ncbi:MAG TPA: LptA/OstA family protein [Novosphingobium sp.]|nr:LptA/OstA family protein [Novosphingobium sp.]HZV09050.1 LptA/OstA family protein [Novosphingobium sp.]
MSRPNASPARPFRLAPGLRALALVGLLTGSAAALAAGLSGHDSDAPVNYSADRIEVMDKDHRVLLTGNVDITQDELRLRSDRALVAYTNSGGSDGEGVKIQRLDATGHVIVTRRDQTATGDVGTYDFNSRIITMVGNVELHRGTESSRGGRLVIDLDKSTSNFVGAGGKLTNGSSAPGRVSGTFSVKKKDKAAQ